jgi:Arc/MetJ-type ribon-helix-helix transcriptional regulator
MSQKYKTVSIPINLYETVRMIVKISPRYISMSEFVKEAIRDKIKNSLEIDQTLKNHVNNNYSK